MCMLILHMHRQGEAVHAQHVGQRIMEVAAKGMKDVAHVDVLERLPVQSTVSTRVAIVTGINQFLTYLFLHYAEVLQDFVDTVHRVRVSLVKLTEKPKHIVEVGGISAVVVKRQSLSVLVPSVLNGAFQTVVIDKVKSRAAHHFPHLRYLGI